MNTKSILSTAVLVAIFAVPTLAQQPNSFDGKPDSWWRAVEYQITTSLQSNMESVQVSQMKNAIAMSTFYRNRIDLTASVPALIEFHQNCDDAQRRALAVAALQSIDSWEGRRYLRKKVSTDELEAGRSLMMAVLSSYTSGEPMAAL